MECNYYCQDMTLPLQTSDLICNGFRHLLVKHITREVLNLNYPMNAPMLLVVLSHNCTAMEWMEKSLETCYGKSHSSTTVFISPFRTKVSAYCILSSQVFWAKPWWGAGLSRRCPTSIPWDFTTARDTTLLYSLAESTAYSFLLLCFTTLPKSLLQNMVFFWLFVCFFPHCSHFCYMHINTVSETPWKPGSFIWVLSAHSGIADTIPEIQMVSYPPNTFLITLFILVTCNWPLLLSRHCNPTLALTPTCNSNEAH